MSKPIPKNPNKYDYTENLKQAWIPPTITPLNVNTNTQSGPVLSTEGVGSAHTGS